jgi:hypothetical protein
VTTRISYAVYLTQFPIFLFNVGQIRTASHYEFFSAMVSSRYTKTERSIASSFDPSLRIRLIGPSD